MVVAIVDAGTGVLAETPDFLARGFAHDATFEPVVLVIEKRWPTPPRRASATPTSSNNSSHTPWPSGPSAPTGAGP